MGSYANNHLIKDETVAYEAKLHWKIFHNISRPMAFRKAFQELC